MLSFPARALGIIVACVMAAGNAAAYTLSSDEGNFTVELPAAPVFSKLNEQAAGGPMTRYQWLVDQSDRAWLVTYNDYPYAVEERYDLAVKGSLDGNQGKLKSQGSIVHRGINGWEVFYETAASLLVRQRLFWVRGRLYQLIYAGPPGTEKNPEVNSYMNSFQMRR